MGDTATVLVISPPLIKKIDHYCTEALLFSFVLEKLKNPIDIMALDVNNDIDNNYNNSI